MKERGRKMRQKLRIRWKALKMGNKKKHKKFFCGVYGTSSIGNPGDDSTDFKQELRRCVLLCIDFIAVDCSELSPSRVKD